MKKIAVVEDENDVRKLLNLHLTREGWQVEAFSSGVDFLDIVSKDKFDLLLLDLMIPGLDGLEICKILRSNSDTKALPIIMVTAKGSEADIVLGLELGADDYVSKPFSIRELIARVKSVLRRINPGEETKTFRSGSIELSPDKFELKVDGVPVNLTATEFKILEILVKNKGRVLTRARILDYLGEDRQFVIDRTIDVHILNLRRKLQAAGDVIETIRSIGYRLRKCEED
ncbi:response regulator transcription factor [bacterium]|nr:response regulator transcription factor [bacterium]